MKIEKNFRKDFDNRIKQLCEDFCDQADERKFLIRCIHYFAYSLVYLGITVVTDLYSKS